MAEKAGPRFETPADVLRHLVVHGPARNEAERDELLAALSEDKPKQEAPK